MKKRLAFLFIAVMIALLLIILIPLQNIFGLHRSRLEDDARKSSRDYTGWNSIISTDEDIAVVLLYDVKSKINEYSVYTKHKGFSFGFFFRHGGMTDISADSLQRLKFDDNGSVIISMNSSHISRLTIDNGIEPKQIDIDPNMPFAIALPSNCGIVRAFNVLNEEVTITAVNG